MLNENKPRPYWYVDAKWIFGLLSLAVLGAWLGLVGTYRLTDKNSAPAFVSALATTLFDRAQSESQIDIAKLNQQLAPLYEQGPQGVAAKISDNPTEQIKINDQLKSFGLFTQSSHQALGLNLAISTVVTLLVLGGLVFFSHRYGRLVSLGLVMLVASLPGALVFTTFATGSGDSGVHIASIGPSVLRLVGNAFLPAYLITLALAIVLLLAAAVLKLARR